MNEQINETRKYLYNHTSQETAYVVEGYPWSFRLRTTIRYWIETSEAKNGGQRFCSQTINPKTGKWCAPKKTTYSNVEIMYLDENEHVKVTAINMYTDNDKLRQFVETHKDNLTEFQKKQIKELIAINNVMKHVTCEIRPSPVGAVSLFSKDPADVAKREQLLKEQEQREVEKAETFKRINRAINFEMSRVEL